VNGTHAGACLKPIGEYSEKTQPLAGSLGLPEKYDKETAEEEEDGRRPGRKQGPVQLILFPVHATLLTSALPSLSDALIPVSSAHTKNHVDNRHVESP
jgi:hypothetical protein